jgi:transposase
MEHLNALPNTLLGKASHYAQSQRKYLERYLLDGRLEISNNRAERSIKPFVIGRNYVPNIFMCWGEAEQVSS